MVVVVRNVAGVAVLDLARRVRIRVPNRLALAVLVPRALNLIRGRRGAPVEAFREFARLPSRCWWLLCRGRIRWCGRWLARQRRPGADAERGHSCGLDEVAAVEVVRHGVAP